MSSNIAKKIGEDPGLNGASGRGEDDEDKSPLIDKRTTDFQPGTCSRSLKDNVTDFPTASFAKIIKREDGAKIPQAIAHRGYKAKFPENSMSSFKGAVEVGAHALETDVHLTKDGVVVLSHVSSLTRPREQG
jgi:Glycerophosphoryl diester phosphodiesterase family